MNGRFESSGKPKKGVAIIRSKRSCLHLYSHKILAPKTQFVSAYTLFPTSVYPLFLIGLSHSYEDPSADSRILISLLNLGPILQHGVSERTRAVFAQSLRSTHEFPEYTREFHYPQSSIQPFRQCPLIVLLFCTNQVLAVPEAWNSRSTVGSGNGSVEQK